jgi:hypothetical protein
MYIIKNIIFVNEVFYQFYDLMNVAEMHQIFVINLLIFVYFILELNALSLNKNQIKILKMLMQIYLSALM